MNLPVFDIAFQILGSPVTWLEVAGFVLSLWMVERNMRVDPLAWPLAMAASLVYGLLFLQSRIYGQAGLQVVFIAFAAWGWWQWRRGRDSAGAPLVVRPLSARGRWLALGAALAAWPLLGALLDRTTDSPVPWLDGALTAGALVGQWLLARKHIENWPTWLAVNMGSVALFASQGLWLTVVLYAVFAVLSWFGWQSWRALIGQRDAATAAA